MPLLTSVNRWYRRIQADRTFAPILTGTAFTLMARVTETALALASSLLVTRCYGAEAMGTLALVTSVMTITTIISVMGTGTSILRMIPEHLSRHSVASAFRVYRKTQYAVAVISALTGVLLFAASGLIADTLLNKPHLRMVVAIAAPFVIFKSLMILNTQAVRGLKLIRTFALMHVMPQGLLLMMLAAGIALGFNGHRTESPALAQLIAWSLTGVIGALIMDRAFRRRLEPGQVVHEVPVRGILAVSMPMLMAASMSLVIGQTGVIMLGMHYSEATVGLYAIAVKLAALTTFILQSINSMSAPTFSQLFHEERIDELLRIARKSTRMIFWLTTPILLALLLLGRPVLLLFGPDFGEAYPALVILVAGQFFNTVSGSTGYFMNMTGHQIALRNFMAGAALLNVGANLVLTPHFGILGAAVAAAISTIFWNAGALLFIRRRFGSTIGYLPGFRR